MSRSMSGMKGQNGMSGPSRPSGLSGLDGLTGLMRSTDREHDYSQAYVCVWMNALNGRTDLGRLARGRAYFDDGRVIGLRVEPGTVRGRVIGTSLAPYEVAISVSEYKDSEWKAASRMTMPGEDPVETPAPEQILARLDGLWRSLGLSTFEEKLDFAVRVGCSCPDYEAVCKHVVALWHAFGERLSSDPSVFITLFGGPADSWIRSGSGMRAASEAGVGSQMILLPAHAEHNLQDRSIEELVSRFWRPIREIRQPEDARTVSDLELPFDDVSGIPCEDPEAVRQVLERMYAEVRRRAAEIRLDIQRA